jgi:sulfur carrier protein ThiS
MIEAQCHDEEGKGFVEFRRKVKSAEVLSASIEKLLRALHFTGRLCIVIQNGQVLKSGYEEGYFRNMGSELVTAL